MKRSRCLKGIIFVAGIFFFFALFSRILSVKWNKYRAFYTLEKNELDYITLGMSHVYYGIDPVYIYAHSGYRGYNLGDEAQNVQFSYFWLMEALKTQHPKYVFFDVGSLFYSESYMDESWKLKEFSAMPLTWQKVKNIQETSADTFTKAGMVWPLLTEHGRWSELSAGDFKPGTGGTMGAAIVMTSNGTEKPVIVNPYQVENVTDVEYTEYALISDSNTAYFEKMMELCAAHDATLVPFKVPTNNWDNVRKTMAEEYLAGYGMQLFDLNEEIPDIDWQQDSFDTGYHLNYWGCCKTSDCLARYMEGRGEAAAVSDQVTSAWEKTAASHGLEFTEKLLTRDDQREEFTSWLSCTFPQYLVLITINDHYDAETDEVNKFLNNIGLGTHEINDRIDSFTAMIDRGERVFSRNSADKKIFFEMNLNRNEEEHNLKLRSAGKASHLITQAGYASIQLDGNELAANLQGINIVILDPDTLGLISSVVIFGDPDSFVHHLGSRATYENPASIQIETPGILKENNTEDEQNAAHPAEARVKFKSSDRGTVFVCNEEDLYLTVERSGNKEGTKAVWQKFDGLPDQKWLISLGDSDDFYLRSIYNHLYLNIIDERSMSLGAEKESLSADWDSGS